MNGLICKLDISRIEWRISMKSSFQALYVKLIEKNEINNNWSIWDLHVRVVAFQINRNNILKTTI